MMKQVDGELIEMTPEEIAEIEALRAEPKQYKNLTMRQFRLGLRRAGLLSTVEGALISMPGPEGEDARIEFEYASEVERNNALVYGLALSLGLTDEQINELWEASLLL